MTELAPNDDKSITLAEKAAEQLFNGNSNPLSNAPAWEPPNRPSAQAAVRRLGELFAKLPGSIAEALDAARSSGELLSSDPLQGLAEILQNADDAGATEVRLVLWENDLLMAHNGHAVRLRHVLGLATPWLSTKRGGSRDIRPVRDRSVRLALSLQDHRRSLQSVSRSGWASRFFH